MGILSGHAAAAELRRRLTGQVLLPGDEGYDTHRRVWNAMVDRRPAGIARCATPADVAAAVGFARADGLEVAGRCGGAGGVGVPGPGRGGGVGPLPPGRGPPRPR